MWLEVVAVFAAAAVAALATKASVTVARRQRLRRRFGAEYERLVDDRDSKRQADTELVLREKYVGQLGVRPLDPEARSRFAVRWGFVLDKFTYEPTGAIADAQRLVLAVLRDFGYPVTHRDQVISDMSVEHSGLLDHFRSACEISERSRTGLVSAQDICQALADYSALFAELLSLPGPTEGESADSRPIAGARRE